MAVDGSLNFNTKIDSKGFNKGTSNLGKSLNLLRSSFMNFANVAVGAFAGVKIFNFGKEAIESASDLAEAQNVVDVSFGKSSEKMEKFAETCVETYGISKLTAKQTGSVFAAMGSGMGLSEDAATDMAVALTGLSADMASFYNVKQDIASIALKSIYTGETETLKQFGVVMTEANLEAYALSQGIQTSYREMSQAEKVQLRYNYVMQQTSLAQGDFARTSNGWANQTRMLSEKWKEFSTVIGGVLMNVLLPAVRTLNGAMSQLIKVAQNAADALASVFGIEMQSSSGAGAVASSTAEVADSSNEAADNYSEMASNAKKVEKANKGNLASFDKLNTLSKSNSDENSTSGSTALPSTGSSKAPTVDTGKVEGSMNKLKGLLSDMFKPFADSWAKNGPAVISSIKRAFGEIGGLAKDIGKSFKDVWTDGTGERFVSSILNLVRSIVTTVGKIAGAFDKAWNKGNTGKKMIKAILDYATNLYNMWAAISDSIGRAFDSSAGVKFFSNILNIVKNIYTGLGNLSKGFTEAWTNAGLGDTIMLNLLNLFNSITGFVERITGSLAKWAGGLDFTPILTSINTLLEGVTSLSDAIGGVLGDAFETVLLPLASWVFEKGAPAAIETFSSLLDALGSIIDSIRPGLETFYNNVLKPIGSWAGSVIIEALGKLKELFSNVAGVFKEKGSEIQNVISGVSDYLSLVWEKYLKPILNTIKKYIFDQFSNLIDTVGGVLSGIIDALSGLVDFVKAVFKGDWKAAWEAVKKIVTGVWNGIWSAIKGVINSIINGINLLWSGIYRAIKGIVNVIGGVASVVGNLLGQDWNLSIPEEPPLIPKLATGTVVPANFGEFTAVLGDNKREPEVVSPVSTMKQAFLEALKESGIGNGSTNVVIEASGNESEIIKYLTFKIKREEKRQGTNNGNLVIV